MSRISASTQSAAQAAPVVLKGAQVVLKSIAVADLDRVRVWKSEPTLARMILAHPTQVSREEIETWYHRNSQDPNQVLLGIYLLESQALIGLVRLMFIDWASRIAEFGIYIGETDLHGRSLGRESMQLILDYAFNTLDLHRLYLKVGESNQRAQTLYERLGFKPEGRLREHFMTDQGYENVICMGLLQNEYQS